MGSKMTEQNHAEPPGSWFWALIQVEYGQDTAQARGGEEMFNCQRFASSLQAHITMHGFSLREAATRSGVSASTLSRLLQGVTPSMEIFCLLCSWMQMHPGAFFEMPEATTLAQVLLSPLALAINALRSDERLPADACEKLIELITAAYNCLREGRT